MENVAQKWSVVDRLSDVSKVIEAVFTLGSRKYVADVVGTDDHLEVNLLLIIRSALLFNILTSFLITTC